MNDDLQFEGKKYISSRRAAQSCGYTQDYIGQLIRGKKIDARMVGRGWFVSEESLQKYKVEVDGLSSKGGELSQQADVVGRADASQPEIATLKYLNDQRPLLPELKKSELIEISRPILTKIPQFTDRQSVSISSPFSVVAKKIVAGLLSLSVVGGTVWVGDGQNFKAALATAVGAAQYMKEAAHESFASIGSLFVPESNLAAIGAQTNSAQLATTTSPLPVVLAATTSTPTTAGIAPVQTPTTIVREKTTVVQTGLSAADVSARLALVQSNLENQIKVLNATSARNLQNTRNGREANVTKEIGYSKITDSEIKSSRISGSSVDATRLSVGGTSALSDLTFLAATGTNATTSNFYTDNLTAGNITFTSSTVSDSTTTNATSTSLFAENAAVNNLTAYAAPIAPYFIATSTTDTTALAGGLTVANGGVVVGLDSSASFANGALTIDASGNMAGGTGSFVTGVFANGATLLNFDGSASFANGALTIDTSGNMVGGGITGLDAGFSSLSIGSGNATISSVGDLFASSATLAGGRTLFNADGSVSFGIGAVQIDPTGNVTAQAGTFTSGSFGAGTILLNTDSSASFANGALAIDTLGNIAGTAATFSSASFASGAASIDVSGNLTALAGELGSLSVAAGNATISGGGDITANSGTFAANTIHLYADSSAAFANGAAIIDALGNLTAQIGTFSSLSVASGSATIASDGRIAGTSGSFASGAILLNSDSSASFAGGALTIDTSGNMVAAGGSFGSGIFSGNVGIGTTNPLYRLHLNIGNTDGIMMSYDDQGNYRNSIEGSFADSVPSSNVMKFKVSDGTVTGQKQVLSLAGSGNAVLAGDLNVGDYINIGRVGTGNYINFDTNDNVSLAIGSNVYLDESEQLRTSISHADMSGAVIKIPGQGQVREGNIEFWTTPTAAVTTDDFYAQSVPRVVIDNNGNLGVGNAFPTAKLDVDGNVLISGTLTLGSLPISSPVSGSLFVGQDAGTDAIGATNSNFIGGSAGFNATNATQSNFFGTSAGTAATNATYSNFLGYSAGYGATDVTQSNFLGYAAGYNAANAGYSNFLGYSAGSTAVDAVYSNFLGYNAGLNGTNASYSNIFGQNAGADAPNAAQVNFFGQSAGYEAANASYSNFLGNNAGYNAVNANNSNFFGKMAGSSATNANYSNFFGNNAGNGATDAANSIFIGKEAGAADVVNNTGTDNSSILIGNYTSTGGFSNSIAIGQGTANDSANQLNLGRVLYATGLSSSISTLSSAISGGRVGVGTTSPSATFAVTGFGTSVDTAFAVADSNNVDRFKVLDDGEVSITTGLGAGTASLVLTDNSAGDKTMKFNPFDASMEVFSAGNYGTKLQLAGNGFTLTDTGAGLGTLLSYDANGLHTQVITSADVLNTHYGQLKLTSNYWGLSDVSPAINFTTFDSAGTTDQLAKLQIYNGDNGKILLNPTGGNVGIGTTNPISTLYVVKSGDLPSEPANLPTGNFAAIVYNANNTPDYNGLLAISGRSSSKSLEAGTAVNGTFTSYFNVDGSGRTNTRNISAYSDVGGGDTRLISLEGGNDTAGDVLGISFSTKGLGATTKSAIIAQQRVSSWGRNDLIFALNGNTDNGNVSVADERMRITYEGNVGIGTTSPSERLSVVGNILNVADATLLPRLVVSYDPGSSIESFDVVGNYIYAVDGSALKVIDTTNSSNPRVVGSLAIAGAESVRVAGKYAYVTQYASAQNFVIIDISNPTVPKLVVTKATVNGFDFTRFMYISGAYLYLVPQNGYQLEIYNISNPVAPVFVGGPGFDANFGFNKNEVYINGRYAYVVTDEATSQFDVFDISNPVSPTIMSKTSLPGSGRPNSIYVSGRYAYVTRGAELQVIDVSDPSNISVVGTVATASAGENYLTASGRYVAIVFGSAITLQLFDVANPAAPVSVGDVTLGGHGRSVYIKGQYIYVGTDGAAAGLEIYKMNGIETTSALIHSLEAGNIQVQNDITAAGRFRLTGSLNVGEGANISGLLSVSAASTTQANGLAALFFGNVGIGTTSPYAMLSVAGTVGGQNFVATSTSATSTFMGGATFATGGGNVGIGTVAPVSQLEIKSAASNSLTITSTNNNASPTLALRGTPTATGQLYGSLSFNSQTSGAIFSSIQTYRATGVNNGDLAFSTTLSSSVIERLRLTAAGFLGLGTTTPNSILNVSGATPKITMSDTSAGSNLKHWYLQSSGGTFKIATTSDQLVDSSLAAFSINSVGNVGIGTTTPIDLLSVANSISSSGSGSEFILRDANGIFKGGVGFQNTNDLVFKAGGNSVKAVLTSGGNFGVGTTTPWGLLSVNPNGISGPSFVVGSSTQTNFIITNTGAVGIGTSTPSAPLSVASLSRVAGGAVFRAYGSQTSQNKDVAVGEFASSYEFLSPGFNLYGVKSSPVTTSLVLSNATNNYAFYGNPSGAITNWGIYLTGENKNYFSGSVGVGTTSPWGKLSIASVNSATSQPLFVIASSSAAVATTTSFIVTAGGNVGIGTSTAGVKLDVVGDARVYGNIGLLNGSADFSNSSTSLNLYKNVGPSASGSWSNGASGGNFIAQNSTALYNGKIYSWGGNTSGGAGTSVNSLNIYDIPSNTWSTGASGGTARSLHTSVIYNGKIYSWGGLDTGDIALNTLNIYDIASNTWTTGATGGTARWGHTANLYNGKMYVWGGQDGSGTNLNTLDIYDIASNTWSTGTAGGTARREHTSALYNGKIYFFAGRATGELTSVDIYDIQTGTWSTGTSGGVGRHNITSALYNGKVYIWGGVFSCCIVQNSVDIYDVITNTWSTGTAGGSSNGLHAATLYNGKIYFSVNINADYFQIYDIGDRQSYLNLYENGQSMLSFRTDATINLEYGKLNFAGGKVSIGSTTPWANLTVSGVAGATNPLFAISSSTSAFATSTAFVIDSNGKVGIGTSSPSQALSVAGNGLFAGNLTAGNVGIGSTSPMTKLAITAGDITIEANRKIYLNPDAGNNAYITRSTVGTAHTLIYTDGGNPLDIGNGGLSIGSYANVTTAPLNGMIISGNVGVGTTSPYAKLSVSGQIVSDSIFATSTTATSTFAGGFDVGGGALRYDFSSGVTSISNLELGNSSFDTDAGIVTWADMPVTAASAAGVKQSYSAAINGNALLTVYSESDGLGGIQSTGVGVGSTTPWAYLSVNPNGIGTGRPSFAVGSSTASQFVVASSGNIGIGTTTPTSSLTLTSDGTLAGPAQFLINGRTNPAKQFFQGYDTTGNYAFLQALIQGSVYSPIALNPSGGNVGVGTTSPTAQLHTTGTVRFSNFGAGTLTTDASGNVTASSDERLKNIEGNFTRGLSALDAISPIIYKWNEVSGYDQNSLYAGFSAQNVQASIPEAVSVDPRGYYTLSDRPILAATVNAIKELHLSVDTFTARLSGIETRLASLEAFAEANGFASTSTSTIITYSSTPVVIQIVSTWLTSLGVTIENGVAHFVAIVSDMITTKKLTVGDSSNLAASGITVLDRVTGQPACVYVENGILRNELGSCGGSTNVPAPQGNEGVTSGVIDTGSNGGSSNGGTTTPDITGDNGSTTPDVIGDNSTTTPNGSGDTGGTTGSTTPDTLGGAGQPVTDGGNSGGLTPDPAPVPVPDPAPAPDPAPVTEPAP